MINRRTREFSKEDIAKIADTYHSWRNKSPLPQGEDLGEGKKAPKKLIEFARKLRQEQTDAEKLIWQLLRNRQHPINNYILDFYCHEHKLAIEIDGSQHMTAEGKIKADQRSQHLLKQGVRVIRFDNRQVLVETERVLSEIYAALTPTLSQRERGYQDIKGFCNSALTERVQELDYVLTPGRYVGLPDEEDDFDFKERFTQLKAEFEDQLKEEAQLNALIAKHLVKVKVTE